MSKQIYTVGSYYRNDKNEPNIQYSRIFKTANIYDLLTDPWRMEDAEAGLPSLLSDLVKLIVALYDINTFVFTVFLELFTD